MVQRTYYQLADDPAQVDRAPQREVLHGYSLDDINRAARYVIGADRWYRTADVTERLDAVWFAISEHLCVAVEPPTWPDLIRVGMAASDRYMGSELHTHGYSSADISAGNAAAPGFHRFWFAHQPASPEERIVARVAVEQIWPRLTRREQEAFTALAAAGAFDPAARALGIAEESLRVRIRRGRQHFLTLWHQGESPSQPWRAGSHERPRATAHQGKRLTVTEVEALRVRYQAGERLRDLAREAGVGKTTLSNLLLGRRRPAPDDTGGPR